MSTEDLSAERAICEAHRNAAGDAYWEPRAVQDSAMSRRAFDDGFDRGWQAARASSAAAVPTDSRSMAMALINPACDRLREWVAIGPVQLAALESFVDALAATPAPPQAVPAIKDHQIAQAVNTLRDVAVQYHGTQQLRDRIADVVVPLLREATTTPQAIPAIPTMADAVAAGDGTLHGAIDHWQERALKAEAETQRLRDELALCCELKREYQERAAAVSQAAPATDAEAVPACQCEACSPNTFGNMRMILCSICGNKRCPHAADHRNACTNSNEPGQLGSSYPAVDWDFIASRAPASPVAVDAATLTDDEIIALAVKHKLGRTMSPIGMQTGDVFVTDQGYRTSELLDFARAVGAGSREPLTEDEVFASDRIMEVNAHCGLSMRWLMELVQAIEQTAAARGKA